MMNRLSKRIDNLQKHKSGDVAVVFVVDDESEEEAFAEKYPDRIRSETDLVVFRTIYET
jgi:hypothetical protein